MRPMCGRIFLWVKPKADLFSAARSLKNPYPGRKTVPLHHAKANTRSETSAGRDICTGFTRLLERDGLISPISHFKMLHLPFPCGRRPKGRLRLHRAGRLGAVRILSRRTAPLARQMRKGYCSISMLLPYLIF